MDLNGIPSSPNISIPSNGIQPVERTRQVQKEDIEETILKKEEDTLYKHRITLQGPLLHDGPKLNSINIYKHTNHILWNSGDEQTTEILNNAQWASYVANCTREVEDDSDQSIIMDLVDKRK